MKKIDLFPGKGKFYKANLHCHSTFSDGKITVEEIKNYYKGKGYSIVAFSDHNRLIPHNELTDKDFLAINAVEIDFNEDCSKLRKGWAESRCYHLNFFSKDKERTEFIPFERVYDKAKIQKVIDDANAAGFLSMYNHPRWSFQTTEDFVGLKGLFAFEVFNFGCETEMLNGWGDYEYEYFLRHGGDAAPTATDDNHFWAQDYNSPISDLCGGYTMIKSPDLSYDSIIGAMENKNCYASTGVEIYGGYAEQTKDSIHVHIDCSRVYHCSVLTDVRATGVARSNRDDITCVDLNIPLETDWFRVELHNKAEERALTKAYNVKELFK